MGPDRFDELIGLLLDDVIDAAQLDELVAIVTADPHQLERLRDHLILSDYLSQYEDGLRAEERFLAALEARAHALGSEDEFVHKVLASVRGHAARGAGSGKVGPSRTHQAGPRRGIRASAWVLAAVVLLLLTGTLVHRAIDSDASAPAPSIAADGAIAPEDDDDPGVAVLTRVVGLRGGLADRRVGSTVPPGTLDWTAGVVQLEFYCGATVVVEGPASIDVLDESRVMCRSGRLWAHVPAPAKGFTVLAPNVELVDRGTQFGMEVNENGGTEVHVFDGKVDLYKSQSNRDVNTLREVTAGSAMHVAHDGESAEIGIRDADFVTSTRLAAMTDARRQRRLEDWGAFRDSFRDDPRVIVYFPFDREELRDRVLTGYSGHGEVSEGAIVGCEWSEGRWAGKPALEFKRPGDRVLVHIPGEFESLTYSCWLRLDGLDRRFSSLLLTDGFEINRPHWQIRQDGSLLLGLKHSEDVNRNYQTGSVFDLFRLGQWVHLVTVYDGAAGTVTHYVNGQRVAEESLSGAAMRPLQLGDAAIGNWSRPIHGRYDLKIRSLNGRIDELVLFREALDAEEIRRLHQAGRL